MASRAALEYELLGYISEFIEILDDSEKLFIASRLASSPQKRQYFRVLYEENLPKSDLILKELWKVEFFEEIREILCSKK